MQRHRLYISSLAITVLLTVVSVLTGCDAEKPTVTPAQKALPAPVGKVLVINKYSNGVLSVGEPAADAEAFEVVDYLVFMCRPTGSDSEMEITGAFAVAREEDAGGITENLMTFTAELTAAIADEVGDTTDPVPDRCLCRGCQVLLETAHATIVPSEGPPIEVTSLEGWYDGELFLGVKVLRSDSVLPEGLMLSLLSDTPGVIVAAAWDIDIGSTIIATDEENLY